MWDGRLAARSLMVGSIALALFGTRSWAMQPATTVTIQVKGLACPFCAYGLEKRLKETGASKVKIFVDEGKTEVSYPVNASLNVAGLRAAVKNGGFTPGAIEIETIGSLDEKEGRWVFRAAGSGDIFLIKSDETLERMVKAVKKRTAIRIAARIEDVQEERHGEHPPTFKILSYAIAN